MKKWKLMAVIQALIMLFAMTAATGCFIEGDDWHDGWHHRHHEWHEWHHDRD
jgi:hypothetical protein